MKPEHFNSVRSQGRRRTPRLHGARSERGDMLLESLIGILLMLAVGLGLTYSAARMVQAQRDTSLHGLALQAVRNAMENTPDLKAFCASPPSTSVAGQQLKLSCNTVPDADVQVSVGDGSQTALTATLNAMPSGIQLSVSAPESLGSGSLFTLSP